MKYTKLLKNYILVLFGALLLCALVTVCFDPFYHYHKPLPGLKAVLGDKEYQVYGTLINFDYDAVIAGSSVCENYNNGWFDDKFDVTSVKAVRSYGNISDLCFYIDTALKNNDIKYVFLNIDPFALSEPVGVSFEQTGCPMYLYDNNLLNDVNYLFNKDVLFKKIPSMVTKSLLSDYDEGESYNWAHWKTFGEDVALTNYIRSKNLDDMKEENLFEHECAMNTQLISELASDNPDTRFIVFFSPYSILWWDSIYRDGYTDAYIYNMRSCCNILLRQDNIKIYNFLTEESITSDLNNYMDMLHFSADINRFVCDNLDNVQYEVTVDNIDEIFENTSLYAEKVRDYYIPLYENRILTEY